MPDLQAENLGCYVRDARGYDAHENTACKHKRRLAKVIHDSASQIHGESHKRDITIVKTMQKRRYWTIGMGLLMIQYLLMIQDLLGVEDMIQ